MAKVLEKKEPLILVDLTQISHGVFEITRTIEMTKQERDDHVLKMKQFSGDKIRVFSLHDLTHGCTISIKELSGAEGRVVG